MKPLERIIGTKFIQSAQNIEEGGDFVVSKPWEISTTNLHKNIIKSPV